MGVWADFACKCHGVLVVHPQLDFLKLCITGAPKCSILYMQKLATLNVIHQKIATPKPCWRYRENQSPQMPLRIKASHCLQ